MLCSKQAILGVFSAVRTQNTSLLQALLPQIANIDAYEEVLASQPCLLLRLPNLLQTCSLVRFCLEQGPFLRFLAFIAGSQERCDAQQVNICAGVHLFT